LCPDTCALVVGMRIPSAMAPLPADNTKDACDLSAGHRRLSGDVRLSTLEQPVGTFRPVAQSNPGLCPPAQRTADRVSRSCGTGPPRWLSAAGPGRTG